MQENHQNTTTVKEQLVSLHHPTHRLPRKIEREFRRFNKDSTMDSIVFELNNCPGGLVEDAVYQAVFGHFWHGIARDKISFVIDGCRIDLPGAVNKYLPYRSPAPDDLRRFPLLCIYQKDLLQSSDPLVRYTISWYDPEYTGKVGEVIRAGHFDPQKEPMFVLYGLDAYQIIVYPYSREVYKELLDLPVKFQPDGIYLVPQVNISRTEQLKYPYPLCTGSFGPFVRDSALYVPVNTASADNGVFLLELNADTDLAALPRVVLNGANKTGILAGCGQIAPFRFIIEPRITAFEKLTSFLQFVPFKPEIAVSLLLVVFVAIFGLSQSDNIIIVRLLAEGSKFKTSVIYNLIRLLTGRVPESAVTLDREEILNRLVIYIDERASEQKKDDRLEKLCFNTLNSLRLLFTSGRMVANDANMVTKTIDFDCSEASDFYNVSYLDEEARAAIEDLRPSVLSFLLSLVPGFFDCKDNGGLSIAVENIRKEFGRHVKVRLAETLAPVLLLLREIEDLMMKTWGPEYDAMSVFGAFMDYQEKFAQTIEQAKMTLVADMEALGRKLVVSGKNSFAQGVHYIKSAHKISGKWQEWFEQFRSLYGHNDCPFSNVEEFKTLFRETSRHLVKTGWRFNWKYRPHGYPGVAVWLPENFEKDLLPDDSEKEDDDAAS